MRASLRHAGQKPASQIHSAGRLRHVAAAALTALAVSVAPLAVGLTAGTTLMTTPTPAQAAGAVPESFSGLVKRVSPAVVTITAEKTVSASEAVQQAPNLPFDFPPGSPFGELFRHFRQFGGPNQAPSHAVALGSGFIIDPDGYVVTNNHVIDGAQDISIALSSGERLKAKLIGADDKTDVALLKVKADHPLPAVQFGDSDNLDVGDWVIAVGNPFGLGGTVTAGIVSARGRDIQSGPFDDFIQTDASINKGNSGGPMFDSDGKVMGINTAIYSPNGGSVGIGFAIPANVARPVIEQLRAHGKIDRGWLGVSIQTISDDMAEAMGMDKPHGALVADVNDGSPAAKGGLHQGDVIVSVDGDEVKTMHDLPRMIAAHKPDSTVKIKVIRGDDQKTLSVKLGTMPKDSDQDASQAQSQPGGKLGVALQGLDDATRQQLNLGDDVHGVVVAAVDPNGSAAEVGIRPGDVISQVDRKVVSDPQDVKDAVNKAAKKDRSSVLLLINRKGHALFVAVHLKKD